MISPSQFNPSQRRDSRISSRNSFLERTRSVSSIRSRNWPPSCRAKSQLNRAVRALPTCRKPVGLGAKRTRTMSVGAVLFGFVAALAGLPKSLAHLVEEPGLHLAAGGFDQHLHLLGGSIERLLALPHESHPFLESLESRLQRKLRCLKFFHDFFQPLERLLECGP